MPKIQSTIPGHRHSFVAQIAFRAGILGALCGAMPAVSAEPEISVDYMVGFVRYVQWNNEDQVPAWTICITEEPTSARIADFSDQRVRDKPFLIRRVSIDDSVDGCHVLDLTQSDAPTRNTLLQRSRGKAIVTVGNGTDFCSLGGLICLSPPGSDQKFEINLSVAKSTAMKISARLLMLGSKRTLKAVAP